MTRWQDEVTAEEWDEWQKIARQASLGRRQITSLGADDYAAQAIEKLLLQANRPANVEAWLRLTVKNSYIDRWRALTARGIGFNVDIDDEYFQRELMSTLLGPKTAYLVQESVQEVLGHLPERHQQLVLLSAAGFENDEIAEELGYADRHVVSNTLRRIQADLSARFEHPYN
jgi:DNA-directed RNA polymerase specialized sigma24 family protein